MKLREATEEYVTDDEIDLAPRTIASYLHHCNRWEKLTDNPDIDQISKETITDFYQSCMESGLASTTFQSSWRNLKTILNYCKTKDYISAVPQIRRKKIKKKRPVVPALNMLEVMYANVDKAVWPKLDYCSTSDFWRAWLVISYWTGLRLGDMKSLRIADYKPEENTLESTANKTSKDHIYPAPNWLDYHINLVSGSPDGRLFAVPKWSDNRIRREMARLCDGKAKVLPQQMRRLSINQWAGAHPEAGRIIHGTGLGVLEFYFDGLEILSHAAQQMPVPDLMKSQV